MENVRDTLDKKTKDLAHAYEFILFCDGSLDNEVYNTFEACKKYDRESGNTPVLSKIFLNGRLCDVKDAPVMEEPKYVDKLVERIKMLGTEYPLAEFVTKLETKVAESRKAIDQYE